eukprot:scaffold8243_cov129-Isochrysis_galbana.AAC.12
MRYVPYYPSDGKSLQGENPSSHFTLANEAGHLPTTFTQPNKQRHRPPLLSRRSGNTTMSEQMAKRLETARISHIGNNIRIHTPEDATTSNIS